MNAIRLKFLGYASLGAKRYLNYSLYGGRVSTCEWEWLTPVRLPCRAVIRGKPWEIRFKSLRQRTWLTGKEITISTPNLPHGIPVNTARYTPEAQLTAWHPEKMTVHPTHPTKIFAAAMCLVCIFCRRSFILSRSHYMSFLPSYNL